MVRRDWYVTHGHVNGMLLAIAGAQLNRASRGPVVAAAPARESSIQLRSPAATSTAAIAARRTRAALSSAFSRTEV